MALVAAQVIIGRVKDDHFANASRGNLIVLPHERVQMQIAHGTAGETPELQMTLINRMIKVKSWIKVNQLGSCHRKAT
jgi:hypothetical protein